MRTITCVSNEGCAKGGQPMEWTYVSDVHDKERWDIQYAYA
jgi:hypothetical protein